MFCNKCGKTLNPEAKACPSCGQPVGDSRFEGSGYTSSQVRFVPEGGEQSGYAPYTKTTYSSMGDEGGDVYSRTSYRPALSEDEGRETTGPREPEAPAEPESQPEPEPAAAPVERAGAPREARGGQPREELDALGIAIKPLEPIRKTGISPEVQRYIQQMNQQKTRRQRKVQGAADAQEPGAEGAPAEEGAEVEQDVAYDAPRAGIGRWAMRIGGVLAALVVLVAGVLIVSYLTTSKAKIPGVTYDLYNKGRELIKSHATTEYREGIIKLWAADNSGKTAMAQQQAEREEIAALLPEKKQENDELFVETLTSIQQSIENATATDAIAALSATSGNTTLGTLSDASKESWALINQAIANLDAADKPEQLTAIIEGVDLSKLKTPEPLATATPVPYKNLKSGMKNNRQVANLQQRLKTLGWFNGVVDGDFGPATVSAVKKFQKAAGMTEDGIATPEVQERLFADDAPRGDGKPAATPAGTPAATPAPEGGELPAA